MRVPVVATLIMFAFAIFPFSASGQETKAAPKTNEVKQEAFYIDVEIEGVIESKEMVEVSVDTESWTDLKVEKIVEQGADVAKGDQLIRFNSDKLVKSIEEKVYELELAKLGLKSITLELQSKEKTLDLDQQLAKRSLKHAQEDFDYFKNVERPMSEKTSQNSLKSSQWSLENTQEELDQLEKMYTEDELTEESEAIVLKRAERSVEQSQFWLERAQLSTKRTLEVTLPRSAEAKQDALERKQLEHEKSMITLPLVVEQQKITVKKTEFAIQKQADGISKLKTDLEKMVVTAPADGLLYHGKCARGKWTGTGGSGTRELIKGDAITPKKTVMTIVDPTDIFIRCDLEEKNLGKLEAGMKGRARLVAFPDRKATVSVESVNTIPFAAGKFDCKFKIEDEASLMPGLTCKIKVRTYENTNALTLPKAAVFTDNDDDYYVFKVVEGQEPQRVDVKVGKSNDKSIEIVSGLAKGDKVLQAKP